MSFFGFDTTLPRDRGGSSNGPGFFQAPDPFAGIPRPNEDLQDDDDDGLEFEETYDGLGDQLDDADDALNDDTFGAGGGPTAQATVGKDFDFFGQTAKVAEAINEEHIQFNHLHPSTTHAVAERATIRGAGQKPTRTGYEKYKEPGPIPDLQVNPSLWGVAPKKTSGDAGLWNEDAKASVTGGVGPEMKMMSLEEVEAAMLARNRSKVTAREEPALQSSSQPVIHHAQSVPRVQMLQQHNQTGPSMSNAQQGFRQPPPQGPRSLQGQPPNIASMAVNQTPHFPSRPEPALSNGSNQRSPSYPRQILQNPNRHPVQSSQPIPRVLQQPQISMPSVSHIQPIPTSQPVLPQAHPFLVQQQQLLNLSDEQRAAILRDEAKRAERNRKIHLLSKNNGLMTPQDKNFITRIQLQQLVAATGNPNEQGTDNAFIEDFYYQVHSHIRGGARSAPHQPLNHFAQTYLYQIGGRQGGVAGRRLNRGGDTHMSRMEQQVQRAVEAAKLKPKNQQLVIEGSLGKISFSNVKTPKPLLNIKRSESSQDANRPYSAGRQLSERKALRDGTSLRDKKIVLRQIENVYMTLMQLEDHERHLPPRPTTANDSEAVQRHMEWTGKMQDLNQKLWAELKVMEPIIPNSPVLHPFIAFLSYAKGKKAIPRIFRHIDQEQRVTILTMIVVHIGILDVVRLAQLQPGESQLPAAIREEIELFSQAVMPSLFGYVNEAPLNIVVGLLGILLDSANLQLVARTKIGLAILTTFASRAELVKQAGDASEQDVTQWTTLYDRLFDSIEPVLGLIFPRSVNSGEDMYVWQFLAAIGIGASPDQQQRLVMGVKDRVMETVTQSKTLPPEMASQRLGNVNLFMRAIGLDVDLLD